MNISDRVDHLGPEAVSLVSEGLEAPPVYRGLSTEYADPVRLLGFLEGRAFSGLVRIAFEGGEARVLLFRGRPHAAEYRVAGAELIGAEAIRRALADSTAVEGRIWVHELPHELFPESWWEGEPIALGLGGAAAAVEAPAGEVAAQPPSEPPPLDARTEAPAGPLESAGEPELRAAAPTGPSGTAAFPVEPHAVDSTTTPAEAPVSGPRGDARVWAGLIEHMHVRFKKFRGPALAARLEGEVNAAVGDYGIRLTNGKLTGRADRSQRALQAAAVACAAYIRVVAGQTFLEKSLAGALRDLGVDDADPYRQALGL